MFSQESLDGVGTTLRQFLVVGGSTDTVGVAVDDGRLVVEPQRPRYTLDELLAKCDASAEEGAEDRAWLDDKPVGSELL